MGQSSSGSNWSDLGPRTFAGLAMALAGVGAIWLGGMVFVALISVVIGLCFWELSRLLVRPQKQLAMLLGLCAALAVLVVGFRLETTGAMGVTWAWLLLAPIAGIVLLSQHRVLFAAYSGLIVLAALGFLHLSHSHLVLWLVLVVIVSDVAGYFAGRLLGGPKFWPRISPKKTWSGTVAGWIGAALVGLAFAALGGATSTMTLLVWMIGSALAAFSGQLGDIAESAIKRYVGVKDSSNLIPGHGGVLDRFDAMIGAAAVVFALSILFALPVYMMG